MWDDNYWANVVEPQFRSQSGQNITSSPTLATSPIETAKQLLTFQREANIPAISSLQAQTGEIGQRFATERTRLEGEREPLKQRYQTLLDEITRREKVDISGQERVTSREFGRRGIPLSSGVFEQTLQDVLSPIRQFYTGQTKETGLAQETGLRDLTNLISGLTGQETEQQRAVKNAIAQLQAGEPSNAVTQAISLLQQQQQQQQSAAELALKQRIAEQEQITSQQKVNQPQFVNVAGVGYEYDPQTRTIKALTSQFGGKDEWE